MDLQLPTNTGSMRACTFAKPMGVASKCLGLPAGRLMVASMAIVIGSNVAL